MKPISEMGFFWIPTLYYYRPTTTSPPGMGLLENLLPASIKRRLISLLGGASDERFARIFHVSPDWIVITRLSDGLIVDVNQGFETISGFAAADVLGHPMTEFNVWACPEQRTKLVDELVRNGYTQDTLVQLRQRDGAVRDCMVNAALLAMHEDSHSHAVWIARDVTEQRRTQEEIQNLNTELEARVTLRTADLERANNDLSVTLTTLKTAKDHLVQSEKLAALGALVAGVAHELNTPIGNGITIATSLQHRIQEFDVLVKKGLTRSDLAAFLDSAREAADIMARNLARAGSLVTSFKQVAIDQTSSQRRPFSLAVLASEILLTLNPSIRKSGCTVTTEIAQDLELDSYPGPLGQVLTNLINNAVVHGYREMPCGHIGICAQRMGTDQLRLEVSDSGHGILKTDLTHVFEPFFTTRMGQGGSGLGLHIVHNLVTSVLGGQITVQSEAGQGAVFTLTMPLSAPGQLGSPQPPLNDI